MDLDKIKAFQEEQAQKKKEQAGAEAARQNSKAVADTVKTSSLLGAKASTEVKQAVKASGDKVVSEVGKVQATLAAGQDSVAQAINNLMLATVVTKDPRLAEAADNVAKLLSSIADASDKFGKSNLNLLPVANKELAKTISDLAQSVRDKQDRDLSPDFDRVVKALSSLKLEAPVVNVPRAEVNLDTSPITSAIKELQKSIKPAKIDIPKVDFSDVIQGLSKVQSTISGLSFPVPNYVLPYKNMETGKGAQANVDSDGAVIVRSATQSNAAFERVSDTGGTSSAFTTFGAVSGKKNYIRGYTITNTSSTNGYVDFRDGTGGAILWTVPVPANGGANVATDEPIFWTTANTALAYDVSAALTTVYISVSGYQQ